MTRKEVRDIIAEIQQSKSELDHLEVKAAHSGTPKRLYEPMSAFANHSRGGILLFGLDESGGFKVVGVGSVQRLQEEITHIAAAEMEPALRPQFTVDEIQGEAILVVEIDEVPAAKKPCFYKSAGLPKGAYLRVGNTNRQMTEYEVFGYLSGRGQPKDDEELVVAATLSDLDSSIVDDYLNRLRLARTQAGFLNGSKEDVLVRLRIAVSDVGILRPTVAGLLVFGKYPQEFFLQLMITFVQYFGTTEEEKAPQGARFVDNRRFEGPIVKLIDEAGQYVLGAMRKATLIDGMFRRELPEYPQEALREAIANAIAHRDYSTYVRGSHVEIRMFADRLEVQNPGGLFGNVTVDNIEEEHSTRNSRLVRMMEDMHLVENRGSGIRSILQAMRQANLEPPRFDDRRSSFQVTFHNHTLMNPDAIAWLNAFSHVKLGDRQRVALVYLRMHNSMTNEEYRRLNRVDSLIAGQELRGLVEAGLVEQHGTSRWTHYTLKASKELPPTPEPSTDEERTIAYVREHGSITNAECRQLLGMDLQRASYLLKKMAAEGVLRREGTRRWTRYLLP